jgi:hypothetical protein
MPVDRAAWSPCGGYYGLSAAWQGTVARKPGLIVREEIKRKIKAGFL